MKNVRIDKRTKKLEQEKKKAEKAEKKAEKRCDELNEKGEKYLIEKCGCGLYEVRSEIVCT